MDVSIIIISFNTQDIIGECLKAAGLASGNLECEFIVVDNASVDGSVDKVRNEHDNVRLIQNARNVGFAAANNQAIREAEGRYVLLLNSDAFVKIDALKILIQFMNKHPRAAVVGPKVLNEDGTLQSKGNIFPSISWSLIKILGINKMLPLEIKMKMLPQFYWDENSVAEVDWVSGCCMLIRKDVINEIGFLSEDYFLYYEETDFCYRAKKSNYEIWYVPKAEVVHINRASPNESYIKHMQRSRLTFFKKMGLLKSALISSLTFISFVMMYFFLLLKNDDAGAKKLRCDVFDEYTFLINLFRSSN